MDQKAVFDKLRAWLIRANPRVAEMALDAGTDIIESRVLESLQVVEFILFIEHESGRVILTEDLHPDRIRTLHAIYESFFRADDA